MVGSATRHLLAPSVAGRAFQAASQDAIMLARLSRDLPGWLRTPLTPADADACTRRGLTARAAGFLDLVARAIFAHPDSPYRWLLAQAGCEYGDLAALVHAEGVEGTLDTLAARGVYVTFDEMKGRRAVVRGSAHRTFAEAAFDSPLVTPHWHVYTGGTRGRPGRVMRWLPLLEEIAVNVGVTFTAHGLNRARHVFWLNNPVAQMLIYTRLGQQTLGWLHPLQPFPFKARSGAHYLAILARLAGRRLPTPRHLDIQDAARLAAWIARQPSGDGPLVINTMPGSAVRVAVAAREAGSDLRDVTFHLQSEPVTEARRDALTAVGAGVVVNYGSIETPSVGYSCAASSAADDLHVFTDQYALTERQRLVTEHGPMVRALLLTTLTDRAGKICLNAEPGDYACLERRACGCHLGELGLTTHLTEIRSFEKLSSEGVTFVRSALLRVLEEVLPARFGGSPLDYQLVETEGADTLARLVLHVSPSVGPVDEAAIRATFLSELGAGGIVDRSQADLLARAGSVVVRRAPPLATAAGKILPFHLVRTTR